MIWFFKKRKNLNIDFRNNQMVINGNILTFPLSLADIEAVLGKPSRTYDREHLGCRSILYIYDELGITFSYEIDITQFLKTRKVYIDEEHKIQYIHLYFGDKVRPWCRDEKYEMPRKTCKAKFTLEGDKPLFVGNEAKAGDFLFSLWTDGYGEEVTGYVESIMYPLAISYFPERKSKLANYKLKKNVENTLHFDNFNFKLAIIQVLMYDLQVLEPYFDIHDFAEQYNGKEIDTDSDVVIKPALNFFKKLAIPKTLAEKVEEIYMDGGNDIYMNIIPQWDGEDDYFDLNEVSPEELKQFPNLKKATIMSNNFEKVKAVFEAENIEVESL